MLKPKYSGKLSRPFWKRVHALKYGSERGGCYSAAVILQNIELTVLTWVNEAEKTAKLRKVKKP